MTVFACLVTMPMVGPMPRLPWKPRSHDADDDDDAVSPHSFFPFPYPTEGNFHELFEARPDAARPSRPRAAPRPGSGSLSAGEFAASARQVELGPGHDRPAGLLGGRERAHL